MTREELKEHCKKQVESCEMWAKAKGEEPSGKVYEEHKLILELLEQEPCEDAISREEAVTEINKYHMTSGVTHQCVWNECVGVIAETIQELPPVTLQSKIGKCKDCKWWKDSDGIYRRDVGAESQCPINRREVFEGNGYCYMVEPQESEDK